MEKLSEEHLAWLVRFNCKLRDIEGNIYRETKAIRDKLTLRVKDPNDPLDDFEIDTSVVFELHQDDPEFNEEIDNNIIVIQYLELEDDYDEHKDHADVGRDLGVKNHSHLFYLLTGMQYLELSISDILRIGRVWVDIKPYYQYFYGVDKCDNVDRNLTVCRHCQMKSSFVFECSRCGDIRCIHCKGGNILSEATPLNYHQEMRCFHCRSKRSIQKVHRDQYYCHKNLMR